MQLLYKKISQYSANKLSLSSTEGSLERISNQWTEIDDSLYDSLMKENEEFKTCIQQGVIISKPILSVSSKDTPELTEDKASSETKPKTKKTKLT